MSKQNVLFAIAHCIMLIKRVISLSYAPHARRQTCISQHDTIYACDGSRFCRKHVIACNVIVSTIQNRLRNRT